MLNLRWNYINAIQADTETYFINSVLGLFARPSIQTLRRVQLLRKGKLAHSIWPVTGTAVEVKKLPLDPTACFADVRTRAVQGTKERKHCIFNADKYLFVSNIKEIDLRIIVCNIGDI